MSKPSMKLKDMPADAKKLLLSIVDGHVRHDWDRGLRVMPKKRLREAYLTNLEAGTMVIIEHGDFGDKDHGFSIEVVQ